MKARTPQRTLKRAVRLSDMTVVTSDDLLRMDADSYHEIRRETTRARNDGQVAFVCDECGFPVYAPRQPITKQPMWRHHKGAPEQCPWWSGDPRSVDMVSASQFQGAQESPLHVKLKNTVAELLAADPLTEPGSVVVDQYISHGDAKRKPDVRATYDGKPLAFEIQLATTQIPIIVAREDFYQSEGRHLIWLTWNFQPVERSCLRTAFEDIFYSHNKNMFSLDDEAIALSRATSRFLLRAFWNHGEDWKSKILPLSALEWPSIGLPFAVSPPPAPPTWALDFRSRWLAATTQIETPWPARKSLFEEMADHLNLEVEGAHELDQADYASLLNAILSFVTNQPVGSAQQNLYEVINSFLVSKRRMRFARVMRKVITVTQGSAFFERRSVADKFEVAEGHEQDDPDSMTGRIVVALFPEIFRKRPSS